MNCPTCGQECELIEAEPDVGIMSSGWYCSACEDSFDAEDDDGSWETRHGHNE